MSPSINHARPMVPRSSRRPFVGMSRPFLVRSPTSTGSSPAGNPLALFVSSAGLALNPPGDGVAGYTRMESTFNVGASRLTEMAAAFTNRPHIDTTLVIFTKSTAL